MYDVALFRTAVLSHYLRMFVLLRRVPALLDTAGCSRVGGLSRAYDAAMVCGKCVYKLGLFALLGRVYDSDVYGTAVL